MNRTTRHPRSRGARWALWGAAAAVALSAGGLSVAHADGEDEVDVDVDGLVYVPLEGCRLLDLRNWGGFNVGSRDTPLSAGEEWTIDATTYDGNCVGQIPEEAEAIVVNATIARSTDPTFLSMYPAGAEKPTVSNANFVPVWGQGVDGPIEMTETPNQSIVQLADGSFTMYNPFGNLWFLADVWGYFIRPELKISFPPPGEHEHPELEELIKQLQDQIDILEGDVINLEEQVTVLEGDVINLGDDVNKLEQQYLELLKNQAVTFTSDPVEDHQTLVTTQKTTVTSVTVTPVPGSMDGADGAVSVTASGWVNMTKGYVTCAIVPTGQSPNFGNNETGFTRSGTTVNTEVAVYTPVDVTTEFETIEGVDSYDFDLICQSNGNGGASVYVKSPSLTAVWTPLKEL